LPRDEVRSLNLTRRAPRGPEGEEHDAAAIGREVDSVLVEIGADDVGEGLCSSRSVDGACAEAGRSAAVNMSGSKRR
jgi:hypothetical protein